MNAQRTYFAYAAFLTLLLTFLNACSGTEWVQSSDHFDFSQNIALSNTDAVFAVDISHWSGRLTPEIVSQWKDEGVEHVVVGIAGYKREERAPTTLQQLATVTAEGLTVDAYVFLDWYYDTEDVSDNNLPMTDQVYNAIKLVKDFPVGRLWLDFEVETNDFTVDEMEEQAMEAVLACGNFPHGIYTGKWFWDRYLNVDTFSHLPLWYAPDDGRADFETWPWQSFGGWEIPTGKQFVWDTYFQGQKTIVDLNIMYVDNVFGTETDELPLSPVRLSPALGTPVQTETVSLSCEALPGALQYTFEMWISQVDGYVPYKTFSSNTPVKKISLTTGTTYQWRVRAKNNAGYGPRSNWATFTYQRPGTPSVPQSLHPSNNQVFDSSYVTLQSKPVANADTYDFDIEYIAQGAYKSYYVYSRPSSNLKFWPQYSDTTYRFRVRAKNEEGMSEWSVWAYFGFGNVSAVQEEVIQGNIPEVPQHLSPDDAELDPEESLVLACAETSHAKRYEFELWVWNGTAFQHETSCIHVINACAVTPRHKDVPYQWRVRGKNGFADGPWSTWAMLDWAKETVQTPEPEPEPEIEIEPEPEPDPEPEPPISVPESPVGLAPDNKGFSSPQDILLSCDAVAASDQYWFQVYYCNADEDLYLDPYVACEYYGGYVYDGSCKSDTNTCVFKPTHATTSYIWRVKAHNELGWGPWSKVAEFVYY